MSLSQPLVERVTAALQAELQRAAQGHCLRVDHLGRDDAVRLCRHLREKTRSNGVETFVLDPGPIGDELSIQPERAIELRNRKLSKLCLFVPTGLVDAAASSLANSFAAFDLDGCLQVIARDLLRHLPEELHVAARQALSQLRGPARVAPEHWADYLGSVLEEPSLERAGAELWRIGLVPDVGGEGLANRLEANRRCAQALIRPSRAQTSPAERVQALGLRPGAVKTEILAFLEGKRLRDSRSWLPQMAEDPHRGRITFEKWVFEEAEPSDLEAIEVMSLLDKEGRVESYTRLLQPGSAGTQPIAPIGPRSRVTVKWTSLPARPANLRRWQAELIPSREEYAVDEVAGLELPVLRTGPRMRRATIPLDLDLETIPVRAVQVRIVALDEHEGELRGADGGTIEGLSEEFWLSQEEMPELETSKKRDTVPTLPYARLKAAVELPVDSIDEAPGQWSERDLHYYSVTLNGRRTSRIGLSPTLRSLEEHCIRNPEELGVYTACVDVSERLDPERITTSAIAAELAETEPGAAFLSRRRDLFRLLEKQEHRGLVEAADWTGELSRRARSYATAYRHLLGKAMSPKLLHAALAVDTLHLEIEHTHGLDEAILVLPTHPLRILWYAAYADLLRHWEKELLESDKNERRRLLDLSLIERVAPVNFPAFAVRDGRPIFLFAQNLRTFWGLALPIEARDPSRRVADVARTLGFDEHEASPVDLSPRRLADELLAYREVHPYLRTLRINLLNPGSGAFVAEALRVLYQPSISSEDDDVPGLPAPRLEIVANCPEPVPLRLPALEELRRELYEAQPRGKRHHLAPLFALTIRSMDHPENIPGGDANLSLTSNQLVPTVRTVEQSEREDSSSFYGLLMRLLPDFASSETGSVWDHRLSLPPNASRERHPVYGPYTNDLVDGQREYLDCVARLVDSAEEKSVPSIVVSLSPEDRLSVDALHRVSDWVVTLDRFFGIEFYDDPSDSNLSRVARKYLLDYAPEFLEGLGHRMLVTTAHREEVEEILSRAMRDLGFNMIEESVGEVLAHLKTISGRLALRILGDDTRAREAVSLGVVAAYLRARGELDDCILIPVDSHPELFGPRARPKVEGAARARCDLLRIRFLRTRVVATFIEVKSRGAGGQSEELLHRIVDQIEATEDVFRDLFFRRDPVRLDHVLQRSRLVTILRFYLRRARRYGLVKTEESFRDLEEAIGRLESGIPDLRAERWGFVVNLAGRPQRPTRVRDTEVRFLTARDLTEAGLSTQELRHEREASPSPTAPAEETTTDVDVSLAMPERPVSGHPPATEPEALGREPSTLLDVELGVTVGDQAPVTWRPSIRGSPHVFVLGIPGQGKSWTITRVLCELARKALPALVIDFHGEYVDPGTPYARIAPPAVLDAAYGLPFSPFEADATQAAGASYWRTNCFAVAEIFQYVCELGDIQRDVVYEALRDCYLDVGFEEGKPDRLPTVEEVRRRLEERERERGIRNVVPRCRPLLELGLFREEAGESTELRGLLDRGLVLDLHSLGLETSQLAASAFLLRKVYKDMFHWGEAEKLRLAIVLDEAHRLARDITLPKIMKEGRKFGIVVIVSSQGLADYHPDVVGNAGTKVIFRTNFPMSKKVAGFVRTQKGVDLAAAIEQLDVGEAYVQTPEMTTCARVRMHPLET